ncbi:Clr6 histone deacetylase associated PHD protein-2 Cph2 [Elasticomyces elasticus]|nr:Clr6 histone deacetylase associated PHD protein-2 Cph2 [Elasticomyces elasticus]
MAWQGGFPGGPPAFGQQFDSARTGEDWEEWLRWDPAAEPTSPEDGTFNSGSSKNDSPMQEAALPAQHDLFSKGLASEAVAPPFIVGEDTFDFGNTALPVDEQFLFGLSNDGTSGFDFNADLYQPTQLEMPRIDTNWTLPMDAVPESVTLSALSNENSHYQYEAVPSSIAPSLNHSPGSTSHQRTSLSGNSDSNSPPQPPPKKKGGRKRKAEIVEQEAAAAAEQGDLFDADGRPIKKTSHNVIEKRYRNNLNDKIVELRNAVPALRAMGKANSGGDEEDLEGLTPAHKLNKATVMGKATEYIRHLEKRNKTMSEEMALLQERLAAVEAAIGKSRDRQASMTHSPSTPSGSMRTRQPSGASQSGQLSFLDVPQEQARYSGQQQQYMQPPQQPTYAAQPRPPVEAQNQPQYVYGPGRGGVMSKVMMGAMAGIMVMEGFSEQQDSDTRQLFAVPTMFRRGLAEHSASPATLARQAALPLLKIVCVLGALVYLLIPILSWSPRRKHHYTRQPVRLPQMPSLASPVEVRRKAWLTALQTVYVPKHFLLEVAAVTAKMISLSIRRLVGSDTWNAITGTNKEEEAARFKAWDIAVDAQLAGGDAEVSYHRLLLTLMASGTLPDSPTRLMQKAVHFRVFFWELSNAGYGNMVGFKSLTEKVGKIYWESARKMQKELVQARAQGRPVHADDEVELLPDHLVSLVELECEDVLNDEMIQRAWNLAWNKHSAFNVPKSNMVRDSVVEDHAIRSPLDAVAAWYANMVVDDTLLDAVGEHPSSLDAEYHLRLAVSISPPASATQVRAMATKAVLSSSRREANIVATLEALPLPTSPSAMNLVTHAPAAPDVRLALTVAKVISLLASRRTTMAARERAWDGIAGLHIPAASFTLLTAVACYRLLRLTSTDRDLLSPARTSHAISNVAAELRLWIGTSAGRKAGLARNDRGRVVDLCLRVVGKAGGWDERDSAYGSGRSSPARERNEMVGV